MELIALATHTERHSNNHVQNHKPLLAESSNETVESRTSTRRLCTAGIALKNQNTPTYLQQPKNQNKCFKCYC